MSAHESDPFLGIPELAILNEIEERRRPLQDALEANEFAVPLLRQGYVKADLALKEEAEKIAGNPALQRSLVDIGVRVTKAAFEQIEPLRGILSPEAVAEMEAAVRREIVKDNPAFSSVASFFDKYQPVTDEAIEFKKQFASGGMATGQEIEIVPEPPAAPKPPATPTEPKAPVALKSQATPQPISPPTATAEPAGPSIAEKREEDDLAHAVKFEIEPACVKVNGKLIPAHKLGKTNQEDKIRFIKVVAGLRPNDRKTLKGLFEAAYPGEPYNRERARHAFSWLNEATMSSTGEYLLIDNGMSNQDRRYLINPSIKQVRVVESAQSDLVAEKIAAGQSAENREQDAENKIRVVLANKGIKIGDKLITNYILGNTRAAKKEFIRFATTLEPHDERKPEELFKICFPGEKYSADRIRGTINALNSHFIEATGEPLFVGSGATKARRFHRNEKLDLVVEDKQAGEKLEQPTNPETGEQDKLVLSVKLHAESIQFGQSKKTKDISKKQPGFKDYTFSRIQALAIIAREGRLKGSDLWRQVVNEKGALLNNTGVSSSGAWLRSLRYDGQPVVVHNGGQGNNSYYSLSPRLAGLTFELSKDVPEGSLVRAAFEHIDKAQKKPEQSSSEELTATDAYVIALVLKKYNVVLKDYGLPEVTDEISAALEGYQPDYSAIRGNTKAIERKRTQSIKKLRALIEDGQKFLEFVDRSEPDDPLFKFVEYLSEAADDEGLKLINLLMNAKVCTKSRWVSSRVSGRQLDGIIPTMIVDEHDRIIWPYEHNQIGIRLKHKKTSKAVEEPTTPLAEKDDIQSTQEDQPEEIVPAAAPKVDLTHIAKSNEAKKTLSPKRLEFRGFIAEKAREFILKDGRPHLDPRLAHHMERVTDAVTRFDLKAAAYALERGRIGPEQTPGGPKYSLADVLAVLAYRNKQLRDYMDVHGNKDDIEEDINSAVERATQLYLKALSKPTA